MGLSVNFPGFVKQMSEYLLQPQNVLSMLSEAPFSRFPPIAKLLDDGGIQGMIYIRMAKFCDRRKNFCWDPTLLHIKILPEFRS